MTISARFIRLLACVAVSCCAAAVGTAHATGPFRSAMCAGCTTLLQLQAKGQTIADATVYNGSERAGTVYVTSDVAAISARYHFQAKRNPNSSQDDPTFYAVLTPLTVTMDEAGELDELVFSRKVRPVDIPASIAQSAAGGDAGKWADVNTYIRQLIPITFNPFAGGYVLNDSRTGQIIPAKMGMVITVKFPDGSSAQVRWNGTIGTVIWELVPGSQRDPNGDPYGGSGGSGGSGGEGSQFFFNGNLYTWSSSPGQCSVRTVVCVEGSCNVRTVFFTCI